MRRPLRAGVCTGLLLAAASAESGHGLARPLWISQGADGTLYGGKAIAVADFDGDGRDDIAAVTARGISLLFQQVDGSLAPAESVTPPLGAIHFLHAADLDDNGTSELLLGHDGGLSAYDLMAYPAARVRHNPGHPCTFLDSGDVDRDGATDVYCQGVDGAASLLLGDGAGGTRRVALQTPGFGGLFNQALLADADGDGWLDLLLADAGSPALFLLPGDRHGGFEPAMAFPYPGRDYGWSRSVAVADIDGDGPVEIVLGRYCNAPCAGLMVMRRGPEGAWSFTETIPAMDLPTAVIAKDLDEDGRLDLLTTHNGWSTVARYMGRDDGLSRMPYFSNAQVDAGRGRVGMGDVNGDGNVDVALAASSGIFILHGGRKQRGDLDGDLVSDILWQDTSGEHVIWLSGDAKAVAAAPKLDKAWAPQALGDFDHGPGSDLFWRNSSTGANAIWGFGYDGLSSRDAQPALAWKVVGAGDFDGDDRSDLLWRNAITGANTIWLEASGATQLSVARLADRQWHVAGIGDFDADGRSDILWRHGSSGRNAIWFSGSRARQRLLPDVSVRWSVGGIGDFDRDGRDDVVWRHRQTGENTIWLAANAAQTRPVRTVANPSWQIAAVGDYDGDGESDLLWRHAGTGANTIWLGADQRRQRDVAKAATSWTVVP